MLDKQIFFDPQRKRWKRLRRVLDATAVVTTLVVAGFIFNSMRGAALPELLLPFPGTITGRSSIARPCCASRRRWLRRAARRARKPSDIQLNTGEGLRAAYYVPDDATSYSSFKEHVHQIDMLFPEWLHVNAPMPPDGDQRPERHP